MSWKREFVEALEVVGGGNVLSKEAVVGNAEADLSTLNPDHMAMDKQNHRLAVSRRGPFEGRCNGIAACQMLRTSKEHAGAADIESGAFTRDGENLFGPDQKAKCELDRVSRVRTSLAAHRTVCTDCHFSRGSMQLANQSDGRHIA